MTGTVYAIEVECTECEERHVWPYATSLDRDPPDEIEATCPEKSGLCGDDIEGCGETTTLRVVEARTDD